MEAQKLVPAQADALDPLRHEIDEADRQLIQILARRFDAVRRVGTLKKAEPGQPLLDSDRECRLQAAWIRDAEALGLPSPFARRVLKEILNQSRRLQESLIDSGDQRTVRCGYQGLPGSFSAMAADHLLTHRSSAGYALVGYGTFQEVGKALMNGEIDYGMLPVENSIGGSIADVNRLICDNTLYIVDEEIWHVEQVLAALPGTRMADLKVIRSHPAALTQCEGFLSSLEDVRREPWTDTAAAAQSLQQGPLRELRNTGAICSEEAAHHAGLEVLARNIADRESNETRFVLLARAQETPDARLRCKTSLLFRLSHHEGSLVRALSVFSRARINLTRIESRPLPDTPWEYLFFVDVEGRMDAPDLAGALVDLRACCTHLRLLGSYPCRTHRQDEHLDRDAYAAPEPDPETEPGPGACPGWSRWNLRPCRCRCAPAPPSTSARRWWGKGISCSSPAPARWRTGSRSWPRRAWPGRPGPPCCGAAPSSPAPPPSLPGPGRGGPEAPAGGRAPGGAAGGDGGAHHRGHPGGGGVCRRAPGGRPQHAQLRPAQGAGPGGPAGAAQAGHERHHQGTAPGLPSTCSAEATCR